jgi:hypothetical protein
VLRALAAALLLASPVAAADANHAAGFASCNSCGGTGANTATYGMTGGVNTALLNALSYARRTGAKVTAIYPGGDRSRKPVGYIIGGAYLRASSPYVSPVMPAGQRTLSYGLGEVQNCPC